MPQRYYAGIGSRSTPWHILDRMADQARVLARHYTLRSGRAAGADRAFETGCREVGGPMQLFDADDAWRRPEWVAHASLFHPAWDSVKGSYAKRLHGRNSPIMLGPDLLQPVTFVICWTSDGKASGGTGQALRIAAAYGIPVFNWYDYDARINR